MQHKMTSDAFRLVLVALALASSAAPPTREAGHQAEHIIQAAGVKGGLVVHVGCGDGKLVWRYRAAPVDRRIVAYGQVESVWPVHGSVLVLDGTVYAVAGRTTHMDGLYFYAPDALAGRKLVEKPIAKASFPDVLSSDGANIFMRQMRLDKQGVIRPENVPHLFSSAGFLDDTWWHRKKPDLPTLWNEKIALLARGMVLAGNVLFVAGPPDLFGVAPGMLPIPTRLRRRPRCGRSVRHWREARARFCGSSPPPTARSCPGANWMACRHGMA